MTAVLQRTGLMTSRGEPLLVARKVAVRRTEPLLLDGRLTAWDTWHKITDAREAGQLGLPAGQDTYLERVARGAMRDAFARHAAGAGPPIKMLFQHGLAPSAGNVGMKPIGEILRVREEEDGPHFVAQLIDAEYVRELEPAIRAGLLEPSYAFSVAEGTVRRRPPESDRNPTGIPEVTVTRIGRLREVSLVAHPADEEAAVRVVASSAPAAAVAA